MESQNVIQLVEDYNYIMANSDQSKYDLYPSNVISLLELAYSIGMIEGEFADDKPNG